MRVHSITYGKRIAAAWLCLGVCLLATPGWGQEGTADEHQHGDHAHHAHAMASPPPTTTERQAPRTIPDIPLLDQNGETVHFYRDLVADRVVAMNFIFTSCTTVCPPMGATFAQVQKSLGDRLGRDVHLISVSVDPVTDTPERLKAWGDRFGAADGWTLVTGPKADVDRLLKSLEVFTPDPVDHAPTVLIGNDATGVWRRAYGLAPADQLGTLIDEVGRAAASQEAP